MILAKHHIRDVEAILGDVAFVSTCFKSWNVYFIQFLIGALSHTKLDQSIMMVLQQPEDGHTGFSQALSHHSGGHHHIIEIFLSTPENTNQVNK